MEQQHFFLSLLAFTCGIVSAKWAMELGCNQLRQALWGVAGLLLGPVALLVLYIRLLGTRQSLRQPGGQWISGSEAKDLHETTAARV